MSPNRSAIYLGWIFTALAVVFPLVRLFPLHANFAVDWYNHQWMLGYAGESLRQHGSLPIVFNTAEQAGIPYPIFYGFQFYPAVGTLTTWINPGVALRLLALLVTWLQFRLVSKALELPEVPSWISKGVACLVIWAIYPLTNLYNRSALTEYFATSLLTCALASWFLLLRAREPSDRRRIALGFGLVFALTAGTHPITALYSVPMLGLMLVAAYLEHGRELAFWKEIAKTLVVPMGLALATIAPWVYALARFQSAVTISADLKAVGYDLAALDRWDTRFYPIPFDSRTNDFPIHQVSTPFLDTQLSIPLLILMTGWLLILAWRKRSGVVESLKCAAPGLCAFVFFVWISLSPRSFELLPSIAKMLQIAYRAVTYQDLSLLFAALSLFALLRRRRDGSLFAGRPVAAALLACCVALAGVGVVVKYRHATPIMQLDVRPGPRTKGSQRRQWAHLPAQFYGASAYATPSLYKELTAEEKASTKRVQISIGVGDDFSIPRPLELSLPTASWIVTNVQAFPWNRIEIDGTAIPNGQLRVDTVFLAAFVPAGNHMLALHTDPDAVWLVLRAISFATLALWLAGVVYLNLKACRRSV